MKHTLVALLLGLGALSSDLDGASLHGDAAWLPAPSTQSGPASLTLADAQRLFYNARYQEAAELSLALRSAEGGEEPAVRLETRELRTSALLFQVRRAIGNARDKDAALKQCAGCGALMDAFKREVAEGLELARARMKTHPLDDEALFFLGKFNLNHVWLHLGTLGHKTGWDQYWEARKSLDALLARSPQHVRGRVARAWIDYIVDTRLPRGTKWLLGGGNKKRAIGTVHEAASVNSEEFVHAEAEFALWDLYVREKNIPAATVVARRLARDFPGNPEVTAFLNTNDPERRQ